MTIPLKKLAEKADEIFASAIAGQVLGGAEVVVRALQEKGPQWSGEFGNSWTITTKRMSTLPSRRRGGSPKSDPVRAPLVTGREILSQNSWLIRIENVAPYAAIAMDLEEGKFSRGWYLKGPVADSSKWDRTGGGRRLGPSVPPMKRGVINYGEGGMASRTADLDWFSTFRRGGKIGQIIKKYMGTTVNVPEQYSFLDSPIYRRPSIEGESWKPSNYPY